MHLQLYRTFSTIAGPLIDLYLRYRQKHGKEDPKRFNERLGHPGMPRPSGPIVWVHAASVGEALSVLPLVKQLLEEYADIHVLFTTGTVTSARLLEKRLPARVFHQYVPVDRLHTVRRFLQHWRPNLALWVESELWPNLILETHAVGCPMIQVNARISLASFTKWQKYESMCRRMMACFSLTLAQSEIDRKRYERLGATQSQFIGNLKYDAPPLPADPKETGQLITQIGDRPIWVASSTHEGEELIIKEVHLKLKKQFGRLLTVIIPRHPERAKEVQKILEPKLHTALRSRADDISLDTDCYIADTIGEVGIFYRMAGIVFLGGSLVPHGGQNPLEAARLECALLSGPNTDNFVDIYEELEAEKAVIRVRHADELAEQVEILLTDHDAQEAVAETALKLMQSKTGILSAYVEALAPYLRAISKAPSTDADA